MLFFFGGTPDYKKDRNFRKTMKLNEAQKLKSLKRRFL